MPVAGGGYRRQVQTAPIPGVKKSRVPIGQTQAATLDVQPQAPLAQLGETAARLGSQALGGELQYRADEWQKAKKRQDSILVMDFDNTLAAGQLRLETEVQALEGRAAVGAQEKADAAWAKIVEDANVKLNNDEQRDAGRAIEHSRKQRLQSTVTQHTATELKKFEDLTFQNSILSAKQAALKHYDKPDVVIDEIEHIRGTIATYAYNAQRKLPKGWAEAETAKHISSVHAGVIYQHLADGNDIFADNYFKNWRKQITGDDEVKLKESMEEGSTRGESMREADRISKGYVSGMTEVGNIDLVNRPRVENADGTVSTIRSITIEEDGAHVIIPTVGDEGVILDDEEAIARYHQTGRHLGVFDTAAGAEGYAQTLHERQARQDTGGSPYPSLTEQLAEAAKIKKTNVRIATENRLKSQEDWRYEEARRASVARIQSAKDQMDQVQQQLMNALDNGAPISDMAGLRLLTDTIAPGFWTTKMTYPERRTMESYMKALQKGPIETDDEHWLTIHNEAMWNTDRFVRRNLGLSIDKLSRSDYQSFANLQMQLKFKRDTDETQAMLVEQQLPGALLSESLSKLTIDPSPPDATPEAAMIARLHQAVRQSIVAKQAEMQKAGQKKPKLTTAEIQPIIDFHIQQMLEPTPLPGSRSLWNIFPGGVPFKDKDVPLWSIGINDIPDEEKARIEKALREDGHVVSDDNIVRWYIDQRQQIQLRNPAQAPRIPAPLPSHVPALPNKPRLPKTQ